MASVIELEVSEEELKSIRTNGKHTFNVGSGQLLASAEPGSIVVLKLRSGNTRTIASVISVEPYPNLGCELENQTAGFDIMDYLSIINDFSGERIEEYGRCKVCIGTKSSCLEHFEKVGLRQDQGLIPEEV